MDTKPRGTQRPPSLVMLVPGFPADEEDTQCLPSVQNYVAGFAARHPEVQTHVIAFQYPYAAGTYAWKGATVHAVGGRNRRGLRRLWTWVHAARIVLRLAYRTRLRLLHSFWLTECTAVAQGLAWLLGTAHVASIAGQDARAGNPFLRWLRFDRLVLTAGSAFSAEVFRQHTGRMVDHVVPLGLDVEALRAIAAPAVRDVDLLGVGSLIPLKNYALFIDLVAALVRDQPELKACLVGDGPEREALLQRIRGKNLEQHVRLVGSLPRDDVFRYMLRSRVLLHPARYEAQGYVLLEALFAGLHVVSFETGYDARSPRLHRCRSAQQMQAVLDGLLPQPLVATPESVPTVADTVAAFMRIYADCAGLPAATDRGVTQGIFP